ncbi:uncharacterized protein BO66DRAFT_395421 [Aspergillus aculeatinus CBS 121060]|uniref:Uncharacterized protein n=1 Tax=Aspergillus aculeatinus CBS 121060 TaxID=1448322 RepID=A0ACD1GW02_9EURO|nr:hypothetical protein BO66DRAFT_395421 [Aspergillus aculeatinus CBS 121060]RAH65462.1 hypothetical protein BO66DRAFT_395421 [Aspergillus aculeatinus CBS 121060]
MQADRPTPPSLAHPQSRSAHTTHRIKLHNNSATPKTPVPAVRHGGAQRPSGSVAV